MTLKLRNIDFISHSSCHMNIITIFGIKNEMRGIFILKISMSFIFVNISSKAPYYHSGKHLCYESALFKD